MQQFCMAYPERSPVSPETDKDEGQERLDRAYDVLERETPDRVCRAIRWLRQPSARWVRLPLGILLVIGGFLGFLPILGVELIPVGLLLIAQDLPPLRKPVANATLWLEDRWIDLRRWWRRKRAQRQRK